MQQTEPIWIQPGMREFVREASQALACLNGERLEEMAQSCRMLNRTPGPANAPERLQVAAECRTAAEELAVLGGVLEATAANMRVMDRLRQLRAGHEEYGAGPGPVWRQVGGESRNGNH